MIPQMNGLIGLIACLVMSSPVKAQNPDDSFPDLGIDGTVYRVLREPGGHYLIAGSFTEVGGVPRMNLARLRPDGQVDPGFTPAVNDVIVALLHQPDGRIVIGGLYGQPRGRLARLHADGSLDAGFVAGTNQLGRSRCLQRPFPPQRPDSSQRLRMSVGELERMLHAISKANSLPERSQPDWERLVNCH